MKSEIALLLALAIILGVTGCEKPASLRAETKAKTTADPEIVSAELEPPAEKSVEPMIESVAPVIEAAELSPREEILAIRARNVGKTHRDLEINGTLLGEATIVSIDDAGVRLQLQAGLTDFAWADLPGSLREAWGHDPNVSVLPVANPFAAASEPDGTEAESPAPQALDPRTQARVLALRSQIEKLSENLRNARKTVKEAQEFHVELVAIYEAEEKKAAAQKAARVYARMRASSCSS